MSPLETRKGSLCVETKPSDKPESCKHPYAFIRNNGSAMRSNCKQTVKFSDYVMSTDTSAPGIMRQLQKRLDP